MTRVRVWLFALCIALCGLPAAAQSVKLSAPQIKALLTGNTAIGEWDGTAYRRFFATDGSTIYAQDGARSVIGKWRVDPERDEFQSLWPRDTDWEGWLVLKNAGAFYWASKSTPPTPFRVENGQQLIAPNTPAATEFCTALDQFMQVDTAGVQISLPVADVPEVACGSSLAVSGATSRHCHWMFDHRSDRADVAFVATVNAVAACLDASQLSQGGPVVNHPDTYDLRGFETKAGKLTVSLKDKGALQKTAIFLRMEYAAQ